MPKGDFFRMRFTAPRMLADGEEAEVMLYGEIVENYGTWYKEQHPEDKSASDFDKAIRQVKTDGAKRLLLRINSPGGIINEGSAMRAILANAGFEQITIRIEGLCASAATIPATIPGAHVVITPTSEYMIHNPRNFAVGNADEMERAANRLRREEATFRAMYAKRTGQSEDDIKNWMNEEKWFTAEEAVKYGFADVLAREGGEDGGEMPIAACVPLRMMEAMKAMYANIPAARFVVREETLPGGKVCPPKGTGFDNPGGLVKSTEETDSIAKPGVATGAAAEHTPREAERQTGTNEEEETDMELANMTADQLRAENGDLYSQIMQAGAEAERERIQSIDDMTPKGYEQMAQEAKTKGTSITDYCKMIVKAQREKGDHYISARKTETMPAEQVKGGASDDHAATEADEMKSFAKEMSSFASDERAEFSGGMY